MPYFNILFSWFLFAFLGVIARDIDLPKPLLLGIMCASGAVFCKALGTGRIVWRREAVIIAGILIADLLLMFCAFSRISFSTTIALHYAAPILVTLMSPVFLNEPFRPRSLLYSFIGFGTVLTIGGVEIDENPSMDTIIGVLCAAASSITLAANILYQRYFMRDQVNFRSAVFQYDFWMTWGYLLLIVPWYLIDPHRDHWHARPVDIAKAIVAGIATQGLGMLLFNSAARFIPAERIARMAFSEIAWVILLGAILFHEHPSGLQIAGVIVICALSYLAQAEGRKAAA